MYKILILKTIEPKQWHNETKEEILESLMKLEEDIKSRKTILFSVYLELLYSLLKDMMLSIIHQVGYIRQNHLMRHSSPIHGIYLLMKICPAYQTT